MNLKDYLLKKGKAPKRQTKDWLRLCTLEVTTGSLWAGDPYVADADGCVVKVPRGLYIVEGIGHVMGRERFVSRLRVRLESAEKPKLGKKVGEAGTDSAMMGVCDIKAYHQAIGRGSGEEIQKAIRSQARKGFGVITIKKFPGAAMPFVPTGSDGLGPVLALRSGGKCVGIELSFTGEEEEDSAGRAPKGEVMSEEELMKWADDDSGVSITLHLPDGSEVTSWVDRVKPGAPFGIWCSRGPYAYRIRAGSKVVKDWNRMKKRPGGVTFCVGYATLKSGKYEIDLRIEEQIYRALTLSIK